MKKTVMKILIVIMACAFVTVGAVISISLINAKNTAISDAKARLEYMSQKYAGDFNAQFQNAETIVNNISIIAENELDVSEYSADRQLFEECEAKLDDVIRRFLESSDYPLGVYFTFSPETTGSQDEVWYVMRGGESIKYIDSHSISDEWLEKGSQDAEYYYDTIEAGILWSDAEYDLGNDGEVISYTRAVYDGNGEFTGVAGADIVVDDLLSSLDRISEETGGSAALYEDGKRLVAGKNIMKHFNDPGYICVKARIGDRWDIVITQHVSLAAGSILKTGAAMVILGILILLACFLFAMVYSRKKVTPIIKEAEQKDLLMVSQNRQAKLGEMIGNIAHQWKQPLNSLGINLTNMSDDFHFDELEADAFDEYMEKMRATIESMSSTVDDFTNFLKPDKEKSSFPVRDNVSSALMLMETRIKKSSAKVTICGEAPNAFGYKNEFIQVIMNIVNNALDALDKADAPEKHIGISIKRIPEEMVLVTVFDSGPHIPQDHMEHLYDPYFTTKEENEGTGLGLYMTKGIIEGSMNGKIEIRNVKDGVECSISIPEGK